MKTNTIRFFISKSAFFLAVILCISCCFPNIEIKAAKKPKLNMKRLNLTVGKDFQIRVYNLKKKQKVSFSTSNVDIIAIKVKPANKGAARKRVTITAISVGSATITGTIRKGKKIVRTLRCKVKVSPNAIGIKFMKRQVRLPVEHKKRLETIIKPNISEERPVFECSNPEIATINSRGVVTGIAPGTVTITATLLSCDVSATCTVTITPASEKHKKNNLTKPLSLAS